MTKKEIVQGLRLTKCFTELMLKQCTDSELVKKTYEGLEQVTVYDILFDYRKTAKVLQGCIDALLTEHGDKNIVAFAEEEIEE